MPETITNRRTEGLDSEMEQIAIRLTQPSASIKLASMSTSVLAAPAAPAKAPTSSREQGAKLLHGLCNAPDQQEQDRLAKELDAHLMQQK